MSGIQVLIITIFEDFQGGPDYPVLTQTQNLSILKDVT